MKVVLVGYMASGKSSVGKLLANELKVPFLDLDTFIEEEVGMPIPRIFEEKGEIFFRKLEYKLLNQVLMENDSLVLSTGGGTPCYGTNMDSILQNSDLAVYLQLSIPALVKRLVVEKEDRPLVRHLNEEDLPEFIGKHLFERRPFYSQAQLTVNSDEKSLEQIVAEIKANYSK
nr:shikimate kinase [Allomuricauda sp.]